MEAKMGNTIGNLLLSVITVMVLSGCAATVTSLSPSLQVVDLSPVGSIQKAELGDTLVSKGRIYSYDGIQLHNRIEAGDGFITRKWIIEPQPLIAKSMDDEWTYHYAQNFHVYDFVVGTVPGIGGLRVSRTDNTNVEMFSSRGLTGFKPTPQPDITFTKITAADRPSFTQELIYNGRIGANVKFLYREFQIP
jgi:hypothetical protein